MVFPYIARPIAAPADVADVAFQRVADDLGARAAHGGLHLPLTMGAMTFADAGWRPEAPRAAAAWPVRRVPGALVLRVRRVPIELEIAPWSDAWCELGVRATGKRTARGDARPYVRAVSEGLDVLVREILAWLEEPLFVAGATLRSAS